MIEGSKNTNLQKSTEEIGKNGDSYLLVSVPGSLGKNLSDKGSVTIKAKDVADAIDVANAINNNPIVITSRCTDFQALVIGTAAVVATLNQLTDPDDKKVFAGVLYSVIDTYANDEEDL